MSDKAIVLRVGSLVDNGAFYWWIEAGGIEVFPRFPKAMSEDAAIAAGREAHAKLLTAFLSLPLVVLRGDEQLPPPKKKRKAKEPRE